MFGLGLLLLHCKGDIFENGQTDSGSDFIIFPDGTSKSDYRCGEVTQQADLPPIDMLLAIDTSQSMDFYQKWLSVRTAIEAFVQNQSFADLGLGIQYFPLRAQCKVEDYAQPAVPIDEVSKVKDNVVSSLKEQQMFGGTPMVPLLSGTSTYAKEWAQLHSDHKVVIVLATDGIPDETCLSSDGGNLPNTLANAVEVAKESNAKDPKVPVFVIGVGDDLSNLNQISAAGGTGNAFIVSLKQNIQQTFLKALSDIRRSLACEYKVPPFPSGGEVGLDYNSVVVRYTDGSNVQTFENVKTKTGCDSEDGWYFDDIKNPKTITFCTQTCKKIQSSDTGKVEILFGCVFRPA